MSKDAKGISHHISMLWIQRIITFPLWSKTHASKLKIISNFIHVSTFLTPSTESMISFTTITTAGTANSLYTNNKGSHSPLPTNSFKVSNSLTRVYSSLDESLRISDLLHGLCKFFLNGLLGLARRFYDSIVGVVDPIRGKRCVDVGLNYSDKKKFKKLKKQ